MTQSDFSDIFDAPIDGQLAEDVAHIQAIYRAAEPPEQLSWTHFRFQLRQQTPLRQTAVQPFLRSQGEQRRIRRWRILATAAALLLALVGAGLVGPSSSWFSGKTSTAFAYTPINKSLQLSNGVTLTAIKGYSDPKHLVLYYGVHIPSDLRSTYPWGFALKATLQGKVATVSATECEVGSET